MLDGQISQIFGRVFSRIYLPATLHKRELAYDGDGNPTATVTDYACRAQVDSATQAMRQAAGYVDTDVAIYVLSHELGVSVTTDDEITVKGERRAIASVEQDPAGSYWLCRGQKG